MDSPTVDLAHLRDLLSLLKDFDVATYSDAGMTLVFQPRSEPGIAPTAKPTMVPDDGHSTSNRKVGGFKSDFHHPSLWQAQNGRPLTFDGSQE